uniref:Uncharacterized protein n=1 Tax=Isometrus maculatus TaxID=497827 RepID=A0A0U1SEV9_ISOMC|nr:hypothetical protein [Isometrus maculatus]
MKSLCGILIVLIVLTTIMAIVTFSGAEAGCTFMDCKKTCKNGPGFCSDNECKCIAMGRK